MMTAGPGTFHYWFKIWRRASTWFGFAISTRQERGPTEYRCGQPNHGGGRLSGAGLFGGSPPPLSAQLCATPWYYPHLCARHAAGIFPAPRGQPGSPPEMGSWGATFHRIGVVPLPYLPPSAHGLP